VLDYRHQTKNEIKEEKEYKTIDLSGEWNIKNCDYNAITLDKCKYSFDGEVIEENGPVISIQDKACALGRKVRIDMNYTVKAEYIPNEVFLVCETPEIFSILVNGKKLQNTVCIKNAETPFLTPMRSMGQTSENPSVYAGLIDFCPVITHSSILLTIPAAFIYTYLTFLKIGDF